MENFKIDRARTWTDDDIDYVRTQRKFFANYEQGPDVDKQTRKYCQRMIKSATLVLEHMTGRKGGKEDADPLNRVAIPAELEQHVLAIFVMIDTGINYEAFNT